MAFQSIGRILPESIRQAGIDEQISSVRVLTLAKETLEKFWGSEKAQYIEWVSYKDGVIRLRSHAPSARQELRAWEVRFINELNHALGRKKVTRLVDAV